MAFVTLAVCVGLYVLVYVECLVQRWLSASALLLWICLLALGYAMVFTLQKKDTCAWEQVTGQGILALQDWMLPTSCALAPLLSVGWSLAWLVVWGAWTMSPSCSMRSEMEAALVL